MPHLLTDSDWPLFFRIEQETYRHHRRDISHNIGANFRRNLPMTEQETAAVIPVVELSV